jgi:predicted nucleic acid-binding protein
VSIYRSSTGPGEAGTPVKGATLPVTLVGSAIGPNRVYRARAAAGMSLQEYLRAELITGARARSELARQDVLAVPGVLPAEVTSALRSLVARGKLDVQSARVARRRLGLLRTVRYPFEPFAARVWELRENLTVYDAWYVALAEALGTDLVTADARLARAAGPRCLVRPRG